MRHLILTLATLVAITLTTGCSTLSREAQVNISETDAQAKRDKDVQLAALLAGMTQLASRMDDVQASGLRTRNESMLPARDPDGEPIVIDGYGPLFEKHVSEMTWNSAHELAGASKILLQHGMRSTVNENTNQKYASNGLDGFNLQMENAQGATQNADKIRAQFDGLAGEKAAIGASLAQVLSSDYAGRVQLVGAYSDGIVRVTTAAGDIIGKFVEMTPAGQAKTLLDSQAAVVLLENLSTGETESHVVIKPAE